LKAFASRGELFIVLLFMHLSCFTQIEVHLMSVICPGCCSAAFFTHSIRQIDFSKLDNFENDSAMLMQVCVGMPDFGNVSQCVLQDLLHTAADVIEATVEESALALRGVDLLPDSNGFCCSDELLVQMKDWCYGMTYFTLPQTRFVYFLGFT